MKTLTKLALVSAVAMSGHAFAMQTLGDEELSQATGQDGVTIQLDLPTLGAGTGISAQAILHDSDGLAGRTATSAGAIVMGDGTTANNFQITAGAGQSVLIDIDADGGTGTAATTSPVLNVKLTLPSVFAIKTGDIYVAKSAGLGGALTNQKKILSNTTVSLAGTTVNVQLGSEEQGSMIKVGGSITGGLVLTNFGLLDSSATTATADVGIGATSIKVKDNGAGADLTLGNVTVDAVGGATGGLKIVLASIGAAGGIDVQMTGLRLGGLSTGTTPTPTAALGNVELRGLALNGTGITIRGH